MGLIITGTTLKRRVVGEMADFCPICREVKTCDRLRVGAAWHLYWISFGRGSFAGHEARCPDCLVRWAVEKEDPAREARIAESVALERRRAAGTVTAEERTALLEEPFLVLEPMVQEQKRIRRIHPRGIAGGVVFLLFALVLPRETGRGLPYPVQVALGVVMLVAIFFMAFYILGPLRWYRVEVVEPALVRALRPLEPTREEIEALVKDLRRRGKLAAKLVKPARLHALIEAA